MIGLNVIEKGKQISFVSQDQGNHCEDSVMRTQPGLITATLLMSTFMITSVTANPITDEEVENLVKRSYQYVAMYNVNNKGAMMVGGWNACFPDTKLKDHTLKDIARVNNDSLYITCMLDLRHDPVILEIPSFDSKYVSLMITGYDHFVGIPMATRLGDFDEPEKMLVFSARTEGYDGGPVEGVDRLYEATGDFVSAVFRVMPHASEPERFERIAVEMNSINLLTLSEYRGGKAKPIDDVEFPAIGETDFDIFENNLLEVMQFSINHTSFEANNEVDQELLAAYAPLGVAPGKAYDPSQVVQIDGQRFRQTAEGVFDVEVAKTADAVFQEKASVGMFLPRGEIALDLLLFQSVLGPIGQPAVEAVYPSILTMDGEPMNASHDYVIRMPADNMPPARAFWSFTLYDSQNGFFLPNDQKKYSVGENGGMKLNEEGGIEVYVAAEKPEGVPDENWLPLNRGDYDIDVILRLYVPDLEKFAKWTPPLAEKL